MQFIRIENKNNIATIYLSRPEKRNAMNFVLLKELVKTAQILKTDRKLRAVILTGDAAIFSAGIDLSDLNSAKKRSIALWELIKPSPSLFQKACLIWQSLPVPVICALEGYCFGAGLQLALAADIRICHPKTQLCIMESRWGLVPDMGLSQSLRGLTNIDVIKELAYTARIFSGEYAKTIGLVSHLSEQPLQDAYALVEEIAERSPDAVHAAKQVLHAMLNKSQYKTLRLEKIWQLKLILGKNSRIAKIKDKNRSHQFQPRQF